MNFKFKTFRIFALSLIALASGNNIFSQTCKVKTATLDNGSVIYTEVFEYDYVEDKPQFPGGRNNMIKFINSTREYPVKAYEMGIEGRVTCAFVVYPDGKIRNIQVLRGVEPSLNDEAIRIVSKMPDWVPGKIHDQAVPVRVVTCIPFRK